MIRRRRRPVFVARASYRLRRRIDALRLLPFVGGFLVLLPVLWRIGQAEDAPPTARGTVYLFVVWAGLVLAAGILSRGLSDRTQTDDGSLQDD
ncbi:MAG: hypothetical protein ACRCSU_11965 [Paracoccaceae bacterium]